MMVTESYLVVFVMSALAPTYENLFYFPLMMNQIIATISQIHLQ